jgi:hypothetical protein
MGYRPIPDGGFQVEGATRDDRLWSDDTELAESQTLTTLSIECEESRVLGVVNVVHTSAAEQAEGYGIGMLHERQVAHVEIVIPRGDMPALLHLEPELFDNLAAIVQSRVIPAARSGRRQPKSPA